MRIFATYLAAEAELRQRELLEDARRVRVRAPHRRRRGFLETLFPRFGRHRT